MCDHISDKDLWIMAQAACAFLLFRNRYLQCRHDDECRQQKGGRCRVDCSASRTVYGTISQPKNHRIESCRASKRLGRKHFEREEKFSTTRWFNAQHKRRVIALLAYLVTSAYWDCLCILMMRACVRACVCVCVCVCLDETRTVTYLLRFALPFHCSPCICPTAEWLLGGVGFAWLLSACLGLHRPIECKFVSFFF